MAADPSRAAIDMTAAALREVAGTRLYRHNAFRITGLPTTASRKDVRQRQRQVLPALEAGADVDLGHSLPVTPEEVRGAFDRLLENPHRRLVDELFWPWGTATAACGCAEELHSDHDLAVKAHRDALDLAAGGTERTKAAEQLWGAAGLLWDKALRRAAFWDHVRARIAALDERQLDESVVDVLRDRVRLTLLQPLTELLAETSCEQSWLAEQARDWPGVPPQVVADELETAAAAHYDATEAAIRKANKAFDGTRPDRAASLVYQQVLSPLRLLETVVPHGRHRRTARLRDDTALVLNNCATVLIERDGPAAGEKAGKWLRTARKLVSDPQLRRTVDANRAMLDETVAAFETIKQQVHALVAAGRSDIAVATLHEIKRRLGTGAGTAEIDRLLATVRGRGPSVTPRARPGQADIYALLEQRETSYQRGAGYSQWDLLFDRLRDWVDDVRFFWRWHRTKVVVVLVLAALVAAGFWFWGGN